VAVVGYASALNTTPTDRSEADQLRPVVAAALDAAGITPAAIGVVTSAGSEFLTGVVGTVMSLLGALPAWPPVTHTHTEMDGAFAFAEAWIRLLAGDGDTALVCATSRATAGAIGDTLAAQLDPYCLAPLRPRPVDLAGLQARVLLDHGRITEGDLSRIAARHRGVDPAAVAATPVVASPLREAHCSDPADGAVAMVLAAGEVALRCPRRAWITGVGQAIEAHGPGERPLIRSVSAGQAVREAGVAARHCDLVELHTRFAHEEIVLLDALGVDDTAAVTPSGGPLPADPVMATGLIRLGEAAAAVMAGRSSRSAGHATAGPCLQHNLVAGFEADR
jgi:acetyl-CoA acetyltransferase